MQRVHLKGTWSLNANIDPSGRFPDIAGSIFVACTDDVCGSGVCRLATSGLEKPSWCVSVLSPIVARAMTSRSLVRDVYRVFGSRRGDDAGRRAFQPRCYGRMHAGAERRVHVKITGLAVSYAFNFR